MDEVSNDVSGRVEAREGAWGARNLKMQRVRKTQMCNGAWKARGAHELQNRTFEWRVGARVVSDGVEASTSV